MRAAKEIKIKEEQAHQTKTDLLVLWTDFFKPANIDATTHELVCCGSLGCPEDAAATRLLPEGPKKACHPVFGASGQGLSKGGGSGGLLNKNN